MCWENLYSIHENAIITRKDTDSDFIHLNHTPACDIKWEPLKRCRMWCKIPCKLYSGCLHEGVGDTGWVTGVMKWALPIRDVLLNLAANTSRSLNCKSWHGTITTSIPPSYRSELQYSQLTGLTVSASAGNRIPLQFWVSWSSVSCTKKICK